MKKYTLSLLGLLSGILTLLAQPNEDLFTIKGEIEGLKVGDTLRFNRIVYTPDYSIERFFDVLVDKNNEFVYNGTAQHEMMLIMSLLPADGKRVVAHQLGVELYVRGGDELRLVSDVERIYFPTIHGGIYENRFLSEIKQQENELDYLRTCMFREANRVKELSGSDSQEAKDAAKAANDFYATNRAALKQVDSLYREYYAMKEGADLSVINSLRRVSYLPIEELRTSWERLDYTNKNSYHGVLLHNKLKKREQLQPGNVAPEFTLIRDDSTTLKSSDLRGKYVLIYHFGMCPGSLQIDPQVSSLYAESSRDSLCIIGVSTMKRKLLKMYNEVDEDAELMGMNLRECIYSMTNHPYEDFDMTIGKNDITELFQIAGLPYFIFISPEGRLIERGFHTVLHTVKTEFKRH